MRRRAPFTEPLLAPQEIEALIQAAQPGTADARRPPQQGRGGSLLASRSGGGSDFAELRPYQPGDDPRHIDWRASARARQPLTRSYHTELARPLCLLIDRGPSMRFGSRVRIKAAQALRLAVWLAAGALREGRECSALLLDDTPHWLPPQRGMAGLQALIALANRPCPPQQAAAVASEWTHHLAALRQRLPAGSELLLISDFNRLGESDQSALRQLGRHCDTRAVQVLDPLEQALPTGIRAQLRWGSASVQAGGQARIAARQQRWLSELAERLRLAGIDHQVLSSDSDFPLEGAS